MGNVLHDVSQLILVASYWETAFQCNFFFLELLMLSADPVPQHIIVHRMDSINFTSCTEIGHAQ